MADTTTILSSNALLAALCSGLWFWYSTRLKASIEHEYLDKHEALKKDTEKELARLNEDLRKQTERELAKLNADLSHQNEMAMASFKHSLELAAADKNLRSSHVFKDTADAIVKTYRSLVELRDLVNAYVSILGFSDEAKRKDAAKRLDDRWDEFETFFKMNKIFIPKNAAEQTRQFCLKLSEFRRKYGWLVKFEEAPNPRHEVWEKRSQEIDAMMYDIPKLLTALEDQFQEILGFPIDNKPVVK